MFVGCAIDVPIDPILIRDVFDPTALAVSTALVLLPVHVKLLLVASRSMMPVGKRLAPNGFGANTKAHDRVGGLLSNNLSKLQYMCHHFTTMQPLLNNPQITQQFI